MACETCGNCGGIPVLPGALDCVCINNTYRVTLVSLTHPTVTTTTLTYEVCSCGDPNVSHWVLETCPGGPVPLTCPEPDDSSISTHIACGGGNFFTFDNVKLEPGVQADPSCEEYDLIYNVFFTEDDLTKVRVGIKAGNCNSCDPNEDPCFVGRILGPGQCGLLPSPCPDVNPQTCCQILVKHVMDLNPPLPKNNVGTVYSNVKAGAVQGRRSLLRKGRCQRYFK